MCATGEPWVPLFCPNCEVFNIGLVDQDVVELGSPNMGLPYTCGWCHSQQRDWSHVAQCRLTIVASRIKDRSAQVVDLLELREELRCG